MMSSLLRLTVCVLMLTGFCAVVAQQPAPQKKLKPSNTHLLNLISDRQKLKRVTKEPHLMEPVPAAACALFAPKESINPHVELFVHVFVTKQAHEIISTGKGVYPVGSVIIKEKLKPIKNPKSEPAKDTAGQAARYSNELFTGMVKREEGYNPNGGDWEYFIATGAAEKMLARGKIDSCIECHQAYKSTDFVTRAYMPASK